MIFLRQFRFTGVTANGRNLPGRRHCSWLCTVCINKVISTDADTLHHDYLKSLCRGGLSHTTETLADNVAQVLVF